MEEGARALEVRMRRCTLTRSFPVTGVLRVEIVGDASHVFLRSHDKPEAEVELHYEVHGWARTAEDAERALLASPPLSFSDGILRVGPEPDGVTLDCRLALPPGAEVEVEVGSGDVSAEGLSKSLRLITGSGDVVLRDLSGEVRVRCGSGDIKLSQVFGAVNIRTGSGDISGEEVKGDLDLETGSGDVALASVEGEIRILTGSGDVKLKGDLSESTWKIRTSSGDVFLALPKDTEAEVFLRTDFGDIECEFSLDAKEIREGRVYGCIGEKPKGRIYVETAAGDIFLGKA